MDLNHNGVSDWTAKVDGQISDVLYPNDDDLDGDGVPNVLDPAPLDPRVSKAKLAAGGVPEHLAAQGPLGLVQGEIYRNFGMIAIEHTDRHSIGVLKALKTVLERGLSTATRKRIESVKYIYAFAGHDPVDNIAAYHRQARALSIGGVGAYGEGELDDERRIAALSSIAHELGHAFLFDQMSPAELTTVGTRFGNFRSPPESSPASDFLDRTLFLSHPLKSIARLAGRNKNHGLDFISRPFWREVNIVSEYATTNIHEWFADAFAATVLQRLGEEGELGKNWQSKLTRLPAHSGAYWVNYNNLSVDFRHWLEARMARPAVTLESGTHRPASRE